MKKIFRDKKIIFTALLILFFALPVFAQDSLPNPIGASTLNDVIGNAIKVLLGLVGILALIMFIYGGLTWMTSGGNAERVKKGKNAFIWAAFGLLAIFLAYSVIYFVIEKIGAGFATP